MANLSRGLSENGGVVFCGVDSTQIVRKAEKLHTTSATCSAALGRLLTGAARSWNVNGLRAILGKGMGDAVEALEPDVLCLWY